MLKKDFENLKKYVKEYKKEQGYEVNEVYIKGEELFKKEDYYSLILAIKNEWAIILSNDKSYIMEIETWYLNNNNKINFNIQLMKPNTFKNIYGEEAYIDIFE